MAVVNRAQLGEHRALLPNRESILRVLAFLQRSFLREYGSGVSSVLIRDSVRTARSLMRRARGPSVVEVKSAVVDVVAKGALSAERAPEGLDTEMMAPGYTSLCSATDRPGTRAGGG